MEAVLPFFVIALLITIGLGKLILRLTDWDIHLAEKKQADEMAAALRESIDNGKRNERP